MDLKEQIKMILDEIRPQFETLGEYGFGGIGTPDMVASSFIDEYESYVKAKNLYQENIGHLPENGSECQFAVEEVDESCLLYSQGTRLPATTSNAKSFRVYYAHERILHGSTKRLNKKYCL